MLDLFREYSDFLNSYNHEIFNYRVQSSTLLFLTLFLLIKTQLFPEAKRSFFPCSKGKNFTIRVSKERGGVDII